MLAKALDDRLGVVNLIELVKNAPPNIDLLAAFTVQEEIGLRGAKVAAYAFNPQLGVAVDSTPAYDLPDWEGEENISYNTNLGQGPAIYIGDGATLSDPRLVRWLAKTAQAAKIPYQVRQPVRGGTDAGAIHQVRVPVFRASRSPSRIATAIPLFRSLASMIGRTRSPCCTPPCHGSHPCRSLLQNVTDRPSINFSE